MNRFRIIFITSELLNIYQYLENQVSEKMTLMELLTFFLLPLLMIVVYFYIRQKLEYKKLYERFKNVTDIDSEILKENHKLKEIQTKINEMGSELKKNIKDYWWKSMTQLEDNIVGIDAAIFMHPTTWKASGHVDNFNDPMIDNKDSKKR